MPFFSIHRPGQPKHAKLVHRDIFLKQKDTVMVLLGNLDVENQERETEKKRTFSRLALLHDTVTNQVNLSLLK